MAESNTIRHCRESLHTGALLARLRRKPSGESVSQSGAVVHWELYYGPEGKHPETRHCRILTLQQKKRDGTSCEFWRIIELYPPVLLFFAPRAVSPEGMDLGMHVHLAGQTLAVSSLMTPVLPCGVESRYR